MGQGRSHTRIKEFKDSFEEVLLCNMDDNFIINTLKKDPEIIDILKNKKCTLFCNASKSGFTELAFETFNVEKCVVNRVKPSKDWHLWRTHKATQKRGVWYHNGEIPPYEKDLPYFFKWRGPAQGCVSDSHVNFPEMELSNGFKINHCSEDIEMYLFEPTRDRLETNMGLYYTALYSIIDLQKDHLLYCGIDFYDKIGDGEAWKFLNLERLRMEGAHMKILLNDYLARYFPNVLFELYTHASFEPKSKNILVKRN